MPDLEGERLVALGLDLDPVAASLEVEVLERAIEVVDDTHVIAVHVHLGVLGLDLQAQAALRIVLVVGVSVALGAGA